MQTYTFTNTEYRKLSRHFRSHFLTLLSTFGLPARVVRLDIKFDMPYTVVSIMLSARESKFVHVFTFDQKSFSSEANFKVDAKLTKKSLPPF